MSYASLAGAAGSVDVIDARVRLPRWGVWSATVHTARDLVLAGSVTLTLGPLELVGTVRDGGPFVGRGAYLLAGGADGWGTKIPAASYRGPVTRLRTLLEDAARLVGETLVFEADGDRVVGPCVRVEGPASRLLAEYSAERWWVETDGKTHVGTRPASVAPSPRALDFDPELSCAEVSDDEAIFLPGQAFASGAVAGSISTVVHELRGSRLRTSLYLE